MGIVWIETLLPISGIRWDPMVTVIRKKNTSASKTSNCHSSLQHSSVDHQSLNQKMACLSRRVNRARWSTASRDPDRSWQILTVHENLYLRIIFHGRILESKIPASNPSVVFQMRGSEVGDPKITLLVLVIPPSSSPGSHQPWHGWHRHSVMKCWAGRGSLTTIGPKREDYVVSEVP